MLRATTVKHAGQILRISWDEAWHIMARAVLRGRAAKGNALPRLLGVDEKAIAKGHRYMTLVCDLEQATVEYVGEERREVSLSAYFEAFPPECRAQIEAIKSSELKTARAWALKGALRQLWNYQSVGWAKRFWQRWYFWATHSRLAPMIEVAKGTAAHLPNVLTYFTHRVTNAVAEGLNSKIASVQKRACGFRNPDRFKIAVCFHCGGLNLYPAP